MKKAKKYIEDFWGYIKDGYAEDGRYISGYDVELVIKYAIKETIEETLIRISQLGTIDSIIYDLKDQLFKELDNENN